MNGREFAGADRESGERVAIISESLARRMFPNQDPLNHNVRWTDPILQAVPYITAVPARIVGVVKDIDDAHIVPKPAMTEYATSDQDPVLIQGRLFIHVRADPYALVT